MLIPDVNILVSAFRTDAPDHDKHQSWLDSVVNGVTPFGISELVLSAFIRIVTNPKAFRHPDRLDDALGFAGEIREVPNCVIVNPGPGHWDLFASLCKQTHARGNLVPDAYLAALAIESGSEWISMDGDFARFAGLRWRRPFS